MLMIATCIHDWNAIHYSKRRTGNRPLTNFDHLRPIYSNWMANSLMKNVSTAGIAAAIFASFTWSMNFVAPFVIGDYSIFDLAACRFLLSGLIGIMILIASAHLCRELTLQDWFVAGGLGFVGYVGYFLTVMVAAVYAGPVIPPAFLGLVPVVLAIAGNFRARSISWGPLLIPLALAATGLLLVNGSGIMQADVQGERSLAIGIVFAIAAVALWTWFGIANQSALLEKTAHGCSRLDGADDDRGKHPDIGISPDWLRHGTVQGSGHRLRPGGHQQSLPASLDVGSSSLDWRSVGLDDSFTAPSGCARRPVADDGDRFCHLFWADGPPSLANHCGGRSE